LLGSGRHTTPHDTEGSMPQVGVGEAREVCEECGAVIGDRERHSQWHELLAPLLPGWHPLATVKPDPDH
jgi:hypothetical protein